MKTFDTPRLTLRPWTAEDLDDAYSTLIVEQDNEPLTAEAVIEELQFDAALAQQQLGERFARLAIILKAENKIIGTVVLMPVFCKAEELALLYPDVRYNGVEVEIGFALSNHHRGQGYATEAARMLLEYGFRELKLARIVAFTRRDNPASMQVLRRLGMRLVEAADGRTVIAGLENTV
ncbi:MAG: GNAT family N-acetyltransferase [Anaerolineae bacterium]